MKPRKNFDYVMESVEFRGHATTPWVGIANKMKDMGYIVTKREISLSWGTVGVVYDIQK